MTYTFTEEQLNNLIDEVMQLASEGVTFERWAAEDRNITDSIDENGNCFDEFGDKVSDAWYFYPIEGDPFDIDDLYSIKQLTK